MVDNLTGRNIVGSLLISELWDTQIHKLKFRENLRKVPQILANELNLWSAINLEL